MTEESYFWELGILSFNVWNTLLNEYFTAHSFVIYSLLKPLTFDSVTSEHYFADMIWPCDWLLCQKFIAKHLYFVETLEAKWTIIIRDVRSVAGSIDSYSQLYERLVGEQKQLYIKPTEGGSIIAVEKWQTLLNSSKWFT